MWAMSPDLVAAPYMPGPMITDRTSPGNPVVNWYKTADNRWFYLVLLQADRFWAELCGVMQRPDLVADDRFANMGVRYVNRRSAFALLDVIFGAETLGHLAAAP